jgi:hypothetical protein
MQLANDRKAKPLSAAWKVSIWFFRGRGMARSSRALPDDCVVAAVLIGHPTEE